jgi:hypothetical protein
VSHAVVDLRLADDNVWRFIPTCHEHKPVWRGPEVTVRRWAVQNAEIHDTDEHDDPP